MTISEIKRPNARRRQCKQMHSEMKQSIAIKLRNNRENINLLIVEFGYLLEITKYNILTIAHSPGSPSTIYGFNITIDYILQISTVFLLSV